MTSVNALRAAIQRLETTLQDLPEEESAFAGARLTRRGLVVHKEHLEQQLTLAQRSELEVHLDGLPVVDHEIRIDALARFLARLQDVISAVAQSLTGRVTDRAPLPAGIREAASLRLATVFPGSFGATLRGPVQDVDEGLFDLETQPNVLDQALKQVLAVMDASSGDEGRSEDEIVDLVAPLGARTFGHLKRLSQHMGDEQLSAELVWTGVGSRPQLSRLTTRGARRLNDVLKRNSMSEELIELRGLLGTASEIRNMVELRLTGGDIVSAQVVDELVGELRRYFGTSVRATFNVVTVVSSATGAEKRTYTLVGLESSTG